MIMNILVSSAQTEITVKKSRFIADIFPVHNQTEARELLKKQKKTHKDASHVVHAFFCGEEAQISGMSDDGEPAGTAGRPVLDVLKGASITNILLTVTRYFGGTLLGTGGLVKAYGDAAKAVLDLAQAEPLVKRVYFTYTVDYEVHETIKRRIADLPISSIKEEFTTAVIVSGLIDFPSVSKLASRVTDASHGKVQVILKDL